MYKKILFFIAILLIIYLLLVLWRIPYVLEQQKTQEAVELINSKKITLEDVTGANLPPTPSPSLVDATVEGIDANNNGVRDDVELAIFERYPTSLAIRAAYLQYAMALQLELTSVFNSETWVAATRQVGRGFGCIYDSLEDANTSSVSKAKSTVDNLVRNTDLREEKYKSLNSFQTSFSLSERNDCDVSLY